MNPKRIRDLEKQAGFFEYFIKEYSRLLKEEYCHNRRWQYQSELELCLDTHDKLLGELFFAQLEEQQNG